MTSTASRSIALSVGEPAGIGPDITLSLAQHSDTPILAFANPTALSQRAQQLSLPIKIVETDTLPEQGQTGVLHVYPIDLSSRVTPGQLNAEHAEYVLEGIRLATEFTLQGRTHAMVTGPVHKGVINDAGIPFSGHTGYIAELCQTEHVVMMLADQHCRVALQTTHIPLHAVPQEITANALTNTITLLHRALQQQWQIAQPCIAVCGLNPHAGEQGHLGREELDIIEPVIKTLQQQGINLHGPLSADTLFHPQQTARFDAILAMYHDQGLAPLKARGFGGIVNITLGLPIIRTSVDHGTALNLAGTGKARSDSLAQAIRIAQQLTPLQP